MKDHDRYDSEGWTPRSSPQRVLFSGPAGVEHGTMDAVRSRGTIAADLEHLAALSQRGYRFSIDHVSDLRIEPRELADRGVRFIKVPAALLLDPRQTSASDIHPSDLSDLLGRFGIDLIAERIEGERAVVDLEKQIRGTHPEVSAVFVKPQSVQVARERQSETLMSPDDVLREDVLTGG